MASNTHGGLTNVNFLGSLEDYLNLLGCSEDGLENRGRSQGHVNFLQGSENHLRFLRRPETRISYFMNPDQMLDDFDLLETPIMASTSATSNLAGHNRNRLYLNGDINHKTSTKRKRHSSSTHANPSKRFSQQQSFPENDVDKTIKSRPIPNWKDARIHFDCWADIFYYAAASDGTSPSLDTNWLLKAATSCKHFAEPALANLYRSPIIRNRVKAKKLADLLARRVSLTTFNYRAKIEALHIDVQIVPSDIMPILIHYLPRLKELIFYSASDQPPYRNLHSKSRWKYSHAIFRALRARAHDVPEAALKPYEARLKSWEWSRPMLGDYIKSTANMSFIHELPSFQSLTRISFTNFQTWNFRERHDKVDKHDVLLAEDHSDIETIAASLAKLPALTHLVFESCGILGSYLLGLLPENLSRLEIINCRRINSSNLAAFLRDKGAQLMMLSLHHNKSLDLGFLTDLAVNCPRLQELDMNMSYFRTSGLSGGPGQPEYDQVLRPDQVPCWPASIRAISLEHVRNWSVEAVEMFLQTLIDNAGNLLDLRHISIKAILDIPWQTRATMRTEWCAKMEKVFLRDYKKNKASSSSSQSLSDSPAPVLPHRRSTTRTGYLRASASRRESRYSRESRIDSFQARQSYRWDPDTIEDELPESEDSKDDDETDCSQTSSSSHSSSSNDPLASLPVHGLCKTVNLVFDNQKVRELQYAMEDFNSLEDHDTELLDFLDADSSNDNDDDEEEDGDDD